MDTNFSDFIAEGGLKTLSRRSDFKGLRHLAGHLGVLACTGAFVAWAPSWPWLIAAWLGHGIVLVGLFAPLHETIHRTAFKSRWLNDAVAFLCGLILFLPPQYFRAFHFTHHRFTQDAARDPELLTPKPQTLGRYLLHATGVFYWRAQLVGLVRHVTGRIDEAFIAQHQRPAILSEARLFLGLYAAMAFLAGAYESTAILTFWVVPVLLGQPALRLYLLSEHMGCPEVPDMFRNTRTTLTLWPLRALAWNMPFHTAHHVYPGIPFHALPALHRLLEERIEVLAPGYLALHRGFAADFNPSA